MGTALETKKLRIIGYTRVSSEEQALHGISLDAQRDRLEAHARAHGYDLIDIATDEGMSGTVPPRRRPALNRALDAVRAKEADGVAFVKLDRLSRSVRDILELADQAKKKGWHLLSVQEHIDTSSAAGKFMLSILASLAEMERDTISERTTVALNQVALQHRARSRFIPFGYRIEGEPTKLTLASEDMRHLIGHREEVALLRQMFELREKGNGAHRIARILNAKRDINPRTQQPWTTSTVAAIMRTADKRQKLGLVPRVARFKVHRDQEQAPSPRASKPHAVSLFDDDTETRRCRKLLLQLPATATRSFLEASTEHVWQMLTASLKPQQLVRLMRWSASLLHQQARHRSDAFVHNARLKLIIKSPDALKVKSNFKSMEEVEPWERELLLPFVRELVREMLSKPTDEVKRESK